MSSLYAWINEHVFLGDPGLPWKHFPTIEDAYASYLAMGGDKGVTLEQFQEGLKRRGYPQRRGRVRVMIGCK